MKSKLSRKNIVVAAIMIFCAATVAGVGAVYADEIVGKGNPMSGLVSAIAQKFNLNEADVQAVFDQQREQMQAQREQNRGQMETKRQERFEARLGELVSSGKLTQSQANAIKDKKAELEAQMEATKPDFKNMTQEERKTAMKEQKTKMEVERVALKQWASNNGIAEEYLPMTGMGFMAAGHGRGGGFGNRLPM